MAESKTEAAKPEAKPNKAAEPEYPDTPSGKALAEVGDLNGEDVDDPAEALEHGEAYAKAKAKARWGY